MFKIGDKVKPKVHSESFDFNKDVGVGTIIDISNVPDHWTIYSVSFDVVFHTEEENRINREIGWLYYAQELEKVEAPDDLAG